MAYSIPSGLHWWAVRTRAQHERLVASQLNGKQIELFLPTRSPRAGRRSRKSARPRPLFPGYLFVHTELTYENRVAILESRGVASILGSAAGPIFIPDQQIDNVRRLAQAAEKLESLDHLVPGTAITIVSGALAGITGVVVEGPDQRQMVACNIELLGRSVAAELPADALTISGAADRIIDKSHLS